MQFVPTQFSPLLLGAGYLQPLQWLLVTEAQQQREILVVETKALSWVMSVVFLLLTLLHYTFYLCNPSQRANRYFARSTRTYCLGSLCVGFGAYGSAVLTSWHWSAAISGL